MQTQQAASTRLADDDKVNIRGARMSEIDTMVELFAEEVEAGRMLPRKPAEMRAHVDDWLVAELDGAIVGCVSLVFFNETLCEVRSLAVDASFRGNGLGGMLISAAVEMARQRGMQRVLALTRAEAVFIRQGFEMDRVANYPEKVWRDCTMCPLRHRCDESAVIYHIERPARHNGHKNGKVS